MGEARVGDSSRQPLPPPPEPSGDTITVTLNVEDARVLVLGPLDSALKQTAGEIPPGSIMRLRQTLAAALREWETLC